MDKELFNRIMVQLEPELAQEFFETLQKDQKKIRAADIVRYKLGMTFNTNGVYRLVEEGYLLKEDYDLLNEIFPG